MRNKLVQSIKLCAIGLTFLFSMGTVQMVHAVPVVANLQNFDLLALPNNLTEPGAYTLTGILPDSDPNVLWFSFTLGGSSNVSLDTIGSSLIDPDDDDDTNLAIYNSSGAIVGQNDDCNLANSDFFSCLDLSLAGGLYYAGVANLNSTFNPDFVVGTESGDGNITLNLSVSAIPVPAAVWLFGTALLGFVGLSRRTSIKS